MFLNRVRAFSRLSAVRLTLSLLLVFIAITGLSWGGTLWLVGREVNRLTDGRLLAQAELVKTALAEGAALPPPGFGQHILVQTGAATQGTLPFAIPDRGDGRYSLDGRRTDYRYLIETVPGGARIIIAENAERQEEVIETLRGGLQWSILVMLAVGLLAAGVLARRGQSRLDRVSDGLAQVAQGHLKTRITLPGPADDLSLLADRINTTTQRLDLTMEQMRVQSSNIAHDLRTPLARLRAGIETSLIDLTERDRPVDADTLGTALEQIDRIVGTFNALLRLARIESGAGRDGFETVDLGDLAGQVADTFAPVIEDAGQTLKLDVQAPAQISGDQDLLVQGVANLIQNALRYGAAGQDITLSVRGPVLSVVDQGPGIDFADREKVLQPLFQLENTRQSEGFGLGLSMVAAIAALHEAQLSLSDGHGGCGLSVTLRFPKLTKV